MIQTTLLPIRRRLVSAAIALGLAVSGVLVAPLAAQAVASVSIPDAVAQILADTNALRAAGGLAPLVESTTMDTVAQNWSAQMYANGSLTHNPNYSTQIPTGWTGAAENIASGYTVTTVVEAWHQSAGHYANIMGGYNSIGIGYYEANGQTYFTQDFGNYATVPSPAQVVTAPATPTSSGSTPGAGTSAGAGDSGAPAPAFVKIRTGSPFGSFDGASITGLGKVTINGWDLDPDTATSIPTHVYVDGVFTIAVTASGTRSDIGNAFPAYGSSHGWSTILTLTGGNHNICTYAIDIAGTGNNTTLGCRTITIPIPTAAAAAAFTATTGFPTRESAGLPAGWVPTQSVSGDYYVRTAGAVVSDLKITNGSIIIQAPNVTLNHIQGIGSYVVNGEGSTCYANLLVQNSTFTPNGTTTDKDDPVIQYGSYTAKNIVIDGAPEGLRVSDGGANCGPVSVIDSFIRVKSPDVCTDWHGDGIQGYGGDKVTVRNTTILMQVTNGCYGTAPFFYPKGQGNTSVDIDGLLVGGSSGYPFRDGMPGPVKNLNVINGSWVFGPIDVNCSVVTAFQAQVVTLNTAGQPISTGKTIGCTGQGN